MAQANQLQGHYYFTTIGHIKMVGNYILLSMTLHVCAAAEIITYNENLGYSRRTSSHQHERLFWELQNHHPVTPTHVCDTSEKSINYNSPICIFINYMSTRSFRIAGDLQSMCIILIMACTSHVHEIHLPCVGHTLK